MLRPQRGRTEQQRPEPDAATPTTVRCQLDQWYKTNFKLSDNRTRRILMSTLGRLPADADDQVDRRLAVNVNRYLEPLSWPIYGYTGTAGTAVRHARRGERDPARGPEQAEVPEDVARRCVVELRCRRRCCFPRGFNRHEEDRLER